MFLIAALCGLRIGEVTAMKVASLDFKRKQIHVLAALDYKTRKETTPKSENSAAPVYMPEPLAKHLHGWLNKHYTPNAEGYLFINSKGQPYHSENVIRSGDAGMPIHVVTRMMRHGDSKVTLEHYAHVVGDAERVASERLSHKIEAQLESEPEMESASIKTA